MTQYYNPSWSKERRRELRKQMPPAETILWMHLRNRGIANAKFRRQFGVGPYIADFFCAEQNIAIELDGNSHIGTQAEEYDRQRDSYFRGLGIKVLRIPNDHVVHDLDTVLNEIRSIISLSK